MRYATIRRMDTSNGEGIRTSIFFQGCAHRCKGCWNPQTWDFDGGYELSNYDIDKLIEYTKLPYIKGLSVLGGEPFQQDPMELYNFLKKVKEETGKSIWLWTGYTYEELSTMNRYSLQFIDVLIDGRFVEGLKDLTLKYRGSSNQRVIDVQATLKSGKTVLYCT